MYIYAFPSTLCRILRGEKKEPLGLIKDPICLVQGVYRRYVLTTHTHTQAHAKRLIIKRNKTTKSQRKVKETKHEQERAERVHQAMAGSEAQCGDKCHF